MPDRCSGPLTLSAVDAESVWLPVGQPNSCLDIENAIAAPCAAGKRLFRFRRVTAAPDGLKPLVQDGELCFRNACSVICNCQVQIPLTFYHRNGELTRTAPLLDSVINRVLNHRLKQQLKHIELPEPRLHLNAIRQLAAVADLLDLQITDDMLQLIGERDNVAAFAESQAEQLG